MPPPRPTPASAPPRPYPPARRGLLTALLASLPLVACGAGDGGGGDLEPPLPARLDGLDPDVASSIRTAAEAVRAAPGDDAGWGELGMTYEAYEMYRLALECYARAGERGSGAKWSHRAAISHEALGELEAAVGAMERSIELRDGYAPSHWRLGSYLYDLGRFDEAERAHLRATELDPEHLGGWTGLARVYLERGETDRAILLLESLLESRAREPYALRLLKTAYLQAGRSADAAAVVAPWRKKSTLGRDPWHREFRAFRSRPVMETALDDLQSGRAAEAVPALEVFSEENPDDLNALAYLAWGYYQLHRLDDASATIERALEQNPDNIPVLRIQARILDGSSQLEEAVRVLERIVTIDPRDIDAWRSKGRVEKRLGRHADSVASLEHVLEFDRRDARIWVGIGRSQLELGRWEEAARSFREAIRSRADGSVAHVGLAEALLEAGDLDGAAKVLREAPELDEEGRALERRLAQLRAGSERTGGNG